MNALAILKTLAAAALISLPATAQAAEKAEPNDVQLDELIVDRLDGMSERYLAIDAGRCAGTRSFLFLMIGRPKMEIDYGLFKLHLQPEWVVPMGLVGATVPLIRLPDRIDFDIYVQALVFQADRNSFCTSDARNLKNVIRKPVNDNIVFTPMKIR